jgi:hypothetical protein
MPDTADRARQIAALADKLQPLGGKTRGMPIEASDWNTVIGVLSDVLGIELAQETDASVLADQRYAPIAHQHLGQVTAAWLDADLQQRSADGGGGVATRQALSDMQRQVSSLQTQVAQLTALIETQQASTDRTASNDIDRTRQLLGFDTRIAGLEGLGVSVTQIAQSQQALQANVNTVLDLRNSLSDANGQPINVAALSQQVTDLQSLRDSLTGADGKPLRLRDLQLQVIDLSNRLPESAGGSLDQQLAKLSADVQGRAAADAQSKVDALRAELTTTNAALSAGLTTKLEAEIAAAREADSADLKSQLTAAESRLNASLASGVATAQASLSAEMQKGVTDTVAKSLAGLNDQIAAVVDTRLPGLRAQLQTDVQNAVMPVVQKSVSDGLATVDKRLTVVESGLSHLRGGLPPQIHAAVDTSATVLRGRIDQQVATQVQAAQTALAATIDQRVSAANAALATQLRSEMTTTINARIPVTHSVTGGGAVVRPG